MKTLAIRALLAAACSAAVAPATQAFADAPAFQLPLRTEVTTNEEMVVTANPIATQVGESVLAAGGNAIDAFVAIYATLGLVEPQATRIGGGGFLLYFDAKTGKVTSYDAREKAPAAATTRYFLDSSGNPLSFSRAVFSGLSFGVPGTVRLFDTVLRAHGSRPMATLLQPAIKLATNGFNISPRMWSLVDSYKSILALDANAKAYFLTTDANGNTIAKPPGTLLKNPAYANTLARIAWLGPDAFYKGPIAQDMVNAVVTDSRPPAVSAGRGIMALSDLSSYKVIERTPVCGAYLTYIVCSMGPPSSGGIAEVQMLGMLGDKDFSKLGPNDLLTVHYFLQANQLAFADRNLYVADSDFVPVPIAGLVDPDYIKSRAALIVDGKAPAAVPGKPPGAGSSQTMDVSPPIFGGTSHVSIVDRFGNVVSATITVESPFGNNRMVDGFIMNNELTDFSFSPGPVSAPVANRVQGGKRPRSSMTPTIVFTKAGAPAFVAGTPGGSTIIAVTAQTVMAMAQFGLDPQQAANQAHFQNNLSSVTTLESLFNNSIMPGQPGGAPAGTTGAIGPFDVRSLKDGLTALGYTISSAPTVLTSGSSIIKITPDGHLQGGADPRREGVAAGQ